MPASVFYPPACVERVRANIEAYDWARAARDHIVERAAPFLAMSDELLWDAMFAHTITRSWHVWSNGHCPACKEDVPMYNWLIDALTHPWKVQCPHCSEFFPKNDFEAFYRSGLNDRAVFDPARADCSLLFNANHPETDDPRRDFGVDDGEGFVAEGNRWRFIGTYLVYGQWKQLVHGGTRCLASAYLVTGDARYAHKVAILLDRIADLHPDFDWGEQGLAYETGHGAGFVSTWHDACEETRELALAYDQIAHAMDDDEELVAFLSAKAEKHGLENGKRSVADIKRNIEDRIFRDAIQMKHKLYSNFPRQEIALAVMEAILDWPDNREAVIAMIDSIIEESTAVDGVTGEKGLASYSGYVIQGLASFLGDCERMQPGFLDEIYKRHPVLQQTYRFHIDTWCLQRYYPQVGDTLWFGAEAPMYQGVLFEHLWSKEAAYHAFKLEPSPYSFLWWLHRATDDPAVAQVMVLANGSSTENLPLDLFARDPEQVQAGIQAVIDEHGTTIDLGSVNKTEWHLGILRSRSGEHARAAWLSYAVEQNHRHQDGMNLGLFAHGLDLMPDFGYPPVQFGGWNNPRADWYRGTASHNTVVVDGKNHAEAPGETTLWAKEPPFQVIQTSCPEMIGGSRFERTVVMVDISETDFYLLDVFRVAGGQDHAKFFHSHYGTVTPSGLNLEPGEEYGHDTFMREFCADHSPVPGWSVDWNVDDRLGFLAPGTPVRLRYTDLTHDAEAHLCEAWIATGNYQSNDDAWIPRVMVRRRNDGQELESTFVAVIEPYGEARAVSDIRRLALADANGIELPDSYVAVEIAHVDGTRDLVVVNDVDENAAAPVIGVADWGLETDAGVSVVRRGADGGEIGSMSSGRAAKGT